MMNVIKKAIKKWENRFDKKMDDTQRTMFEWGYTYAITDLHEEIITNDKN